MRRFDQAHAHLRQALDLSNHDEARASYKQAIRIFQDLSDRFDEATSLVNLGDTHDAAGEPQAARRVWQQALAVFEELHDLEAAASVQAKLKALG